ncbi:MAG: flagellar basal body L-ring protein FlgH [Phycisphaeraceae bacterium]|nr:flagellar basal body L-ring protein FlgH [Phycisphaeraceae bacterium]
MRTVAISIAVLLAAAGQAAGQALLQRPVSSGPQPGVITPSGPQGNPNVVIAPGSGPESAAASPQPGPGPAQGVTPPPQREPDGVAASLQPYSLFAVVPPPPRIYQKHDVVQVVINESSIQKFEATLDTKKKEALSAQLQGLPNLEKLLETQLQPYDTQQLLNLLLSGQNNFKGDGSLERSDRFTTRISATVIDVKPNGSLVLEARKSTSHNNETVSVVVAGVCRPEDITTPANTVQSSQLADLVIRVETTGDVSDTASKGWITKLFDAIFNF